MNRLVWTQIIGSGVGALVGVVVGLLLGRRKAVAPSVSTTPKAS